MTQKLNTIQKKLQFHCATCQTTWQLLEIQSNCRTKSDTKCLNNCLDKWQSLLNNYCQEQIILDITKKEQNKDKQFTNFLEQIKRNQSK